MKDAFKGMLLGAVVVLAVVGTVLFTGQKGTVSGADVSDVAEKLGKSEADVAAGVIGCPDTKAGALRYSMRSKANSSLLFLTPSGQAYYDSGDFAGSGAFSGGTTETYTSITTIDCPSSGTLYALCSSTFVSPEPYKWTMTSSEAKARMSGTPYNVVSLTWRNFTSLTATSFSSGQTTNLSADRTLGTSASVTEYLEVDPQGANSCIGDEKTGIIYAVDLPTTRISAANGFALSGPGIRRMDTCPVDIVSGDQADVCFVGPQICSSNGIQRFIATIKTDVGNPADAESVVVYLETPGYFQNTDGQITYGTFNKAASRQCGGATSATFDLA